MPWVPWQDMHVCRVYVTLVTSLLVTGGPVFLVPGSCRVGTGAENHARGFQHCPASDPNVVPLGKGDWETEQCSPGSTCFLLVLERRTRSHFSKLL